MLVPHSASLNYSGNVCHGFAAVRHEVLLWMPEGFWRVTTIVDLWPLFSVGVGGFLVVVQGCG